MAPIRRVRYGDAALSSGGRGSGGEWFGAAGFTATVVGFTGLFILLLTTDEPVASGPLWPGLAVAIALALVAIGGTARQIGIGLLVAGLAVPIELWIYPIMAALLFVAPFVLLCAIAGGTPYLLWRRARKRKN